MELELLLMSLSVVLIYALTDSEEHCETLPSEIHITKDEFDELGRLQRTCSSDIAVNKCEGACTSQVQPSVITHTGFLKKGMFGMPTKKKWPSAQLPYTQFIGGQGINKRFHKECYCCRESFLRERTVTLTHCYDTDGVRLQDQGRATMDVKLREPADCKCYKCADL